MFFEKEKEEKEAFSEEREVIDLPSPSQEGEISLEETLDQRRSVRSFKNEGIPKEKISQLLFAAQGITEEEEVKRSAPSAGALYPLEVYVVVREDMELESGVYRFLPEGHTLSRITRGDVNGELASAALGQEFIAQAPVNIVIMGVYERTASRYGDRAERYVHMEAGHASQNIYLQCESLNLGTVAVGAFDDEEVSKILNLEEGEEPLYIMPVGYSN